jgi:hypothetical protein
VGQRTFRTFGNGLAATPLSLFSLICYSTRGFRRKDSVMRTQGRYLRFRHVFPELFSPAVQARRGWLRFRWFLLQRIDFRPIWTLGAAAGLGGILLTVSLFFLSGTLRPVVAAREVARFELPSQPVLPGPVLAQPVIQQPLTPAPSQPGGLVPYLTPEFSRLVMPFGWEDRRLATVVSTPQTMQPAVPFTFNPRDGWVRALFRSLPATAPTPFVPYREPSGLRWNSVTPELRVSDVARSVLGVTPQARPTAVIEKQMPPNFSGDRPLEYRLIVTNPSQHALPDVSVFEAIDVGRVTAANPPAQVEPNGLLWKLHGLAPGERRELLISVWTEGLTALSAATDVELADRVSAVVQVEGQTEPPFFPTEPVRNDPAPAPAGLPAFPKQVDLPPFPKLDATPVPVITPKPAAPVPPPQTEPAFPSLPATTPVPGRPILKLSTEAPSAVAVGEDATTWYEIANVGDAPATDIVLRLKLAEGLQHHDGSLDVEFKLPRLEPGEKRRAQLVTRATAHGVYPVDGQLTSGDLRETSFIELLAPERRDESVESAIGESGETNADESSEENPIRQCQCTLLVRQGGKPR